MQLQRLMISSSKGKHVPDFQRENPTSTGQNAALRKEPGAGGASVFGLGRSVGQFPLCAGLPLTSKLQ